MLLPWQRYVTTSPLYWQCFEDILGGEVSSVDCTYGLATKRYWTQHFNGKFLVLIRFPVISIAPCKGIQDSLGFWIPCCGFRIPGIGFRIPAQLIPVSKKSCIPFFSAFNAFLRTSFPRSNLAILKDVVRRHNKFVFFIDLQNYGKKCITVP